MAKMEGRDGRRPNTFWIDNELVDIYAKKIGVHAFAVYMVLVKHSRDNECYPSTSTIAEELGISRPTVSKAIHVLESEGLINIEERALPVRGQTSHMYTILQVPKTAVKEVYSGPDTAVNDVYRPCKGDLHPPVNDVYTNNTKVNKTNLTSGGVAPSAKDAAAAVDQTLVKRLIDEQKLMRDQAMKAAALDCVTHESLDCLKPWRAAMLDRNTHLPEQKQKKPQAILAWYFNQGKLPDDLPAAAAPVTTESMDDAIRRHVEQARNAVNHATFR